MATKPTKRKAKSSTEKPAAKEIKLAGIKLTEDHEVPHVDLLTKLLIKKRKSVLFVGEGDFSFTVAFAALREHKKSRASTVNPGTWDGIIATSYEESKKPVPNFSEAVRTCVHSRKNAEIKQELENLPPAPCDSWIPNIDACHLINHCKELGDHQSEVIWFQCPWNAGTMFIYSLIRSFLLSASHRIKSGSHVCVGITTHSWYVHRYELKRILPFKTRHDRTNQVLKVYDFLGADDKLVKNVLTFGYHHRTCKDEDIHDLIKDNHVTLVFRKK